MLTVFEWSTLNNIHAAHCRMARTTITMVTMFLQQYYSHDNTSAIVRKKRAFSGSSEQVVGIGVCYTLSLIHI